VTQQDVERIVRSVLRDFGLRLNLRSVTKASDSWAVALTEPQRPPLCLTIPDGPPHAVRRAVMAALAVEG
jgi:hypothetical protein